LLFAPCRFDLRLWAGLRRPFVPELVVNADFLIGALFVNANHRHFYFGDYFEDRYAKQFTPWTDYHPIPRVFDPNFAYYRHLHGPKSEWENGLRELYRARRVGEVPRPPRTFAQQGEAIRALNAQKVENSRLRQNINITNMQNVHAVAPIKEVNKVNLTHLEGLGTGKKIAPGNPIKLHPVVKEEQLRAQKAATALHESAVERRQIEAKMLTQGGNPVKHTDAAHVVNVPVHQPPAHAAAPPPPVMRAPPPKVTQPKHEERPIPKYEPPHPVSPPKKDKKG